MVVGAFILGILKTSVNMLGFQPDLQLVVSGVVIIIAITQGMPLTGEALNTG